MTEENVIMRKDRYDTPQHFMKTTHPYPDSHPRWSEGKVSVIARDSEAISSPYKSRDCFFTFAGTALMKMGGQAYFAQRQNKM